MSRIYIQTNGVPGISNSHVQGTQCVESKVGLRESIPLVAIGLEGDWPYIKKAASYIIDSAFLLMDYGHQRSLLKCHPFQ